MSPTRKDETRKTISSENLNNFQLKKFGNESELVVHQSLNWSIQKFLDWLTSTFVTPTITRVMRVGDFTILTIKEDGQYV